MPGQLQNKLQQFEVTPPPSVWNKITRQLDEEFVPNDAVLSSKLHDASIQAPEEVWKKIEREVRETKRENFRTIPAIYTKIAAAAIIIGLISLGAFYFLGGNNTSQPDTVHVTPVAPQADESTPRVADANPSESAGRKSSLPIAKVKRQSAPRYAATARRTVITRPEPVSAPQQAPLYELNTVSALQPVSVSAPPLRDKSGKIILDLATISNPDNEYITVTGPNGKQTKISNKFLNCLGYINGNLSYSEMDAKAIRCTMQFDEWRRRLLSDPAFIPTANNFFDIFELKDLLQEM